MEEGYNPATYHHSDAELIQAYKQGYRDGERAILQGIVFCKECKHRVEGSKMCAHPKAIGWDAIEPDDYDFCSCGERKEGEE